MFLSDLEEGASIFTDANIFIYHFSKGSRFNLASSSFLERAETGSISGFTSTLINHQGIPSKIASFNVKMISFDIDIIERSQAMKRRYGFLSNDALTLQIMEDLKIKNLASNDTDFEGVDFITLFRPSAKNL